MQTFFEVLLVAIAIIGLITLGFVIRPRPFRPHPAPTRPGEPIPLRPDLPAPVRRHFEETLGASPQLVSTAVVWGRGRACIRGVWVPLRFKAWYKAGEAFYRRMEITWYMRPVMRGIDAFDGLHGFFQMGEREETGEKVDQSQLLTLWAHMIWLPSAMASPEALVIDQPAPARWEPVDDFTARLVVPYKNGVDSLQAHFDEQTGQMTHLSALRYADASPEKEPWRVDLLTWKSFHGMLIPNQVAFSWGESGSPWSYWTVDGVTYNVNVSDQI